MARIRVDGLQATVVGEDNATLATGTLQVEFVPGAQRLGNVTFVLDQQPDDTGEAFQQSLQAQVDREQDHSRGGV
jgi:hypothetical protein